MARATTINVAYRCPHCGDSFRALVTAKPSGTWSDAGPFVVCDGCLELLVLSWWLPAVAGLPTLAAASKANMGQHLRFEMACPGGHDLLERWRGERRAGVGRGGAVAVDGEQPGDLA